MKRLIFFTLLFFITQEMHAQVTIGSGIDARKGALLDLKENENMDSNTNKGMMLPRVNLTLIDELYPMFESNDMNYTVYERSIHTGLIVYNLTNDPLKGLCPGPYVWNGKEWERLLDPCAFSFDINCTGISVSGSINVPINEEVYIPYTISNTPYTIPVGIVGGPTNDIRAVITREQTLNTETGEITVTIIGNPTVSSSFNLPITIGGSSCNISINTTDLLAIECTNIFATGYINADMSVSTPVVKIPYTLSSGSYSLAAGTIGTVGSIVANVEAQTLNSPSGFIDVKFSGTPTNTMNKVSFPINIGGSTCSIHLSVLKPPAECPNGSAARAFVFNQDSKWYVVTTEENYTGGSSGFARVIECNNEDEALAHPDALQYCGNLQTNRCIKFYDRDGVHKASLYTSSRSSDIAEANMGCWGTLIAYGGSKIRNALNTTPIKYLGAVNLSGGVGQLGTITGKEAILTDKPLR
ncbi:hypothetical protein [Dysgonomonas sp. 520]|uniref:hypothetical protein n=1 Tax=Dysgonomonas sp. 520 TaxID=2302931 RepID=UPI0013D1287C|nr:hypothetical protein [Dysgonomonas sp. 520]NDW10642.1 hypothetical protein [Dysgonomonas sp. 520]